MAYDYVTLISAVKLSPSPNLAYRTAKELLENQPDDRIRLSKEGLDAAWEDASRFNKRVEYLEGQLSRPPRRSLNPGMFEIEVQKIMLSRTPHAELGRIMSEYDTSTVAVVYASVKTWIERIGVR